MCASSMPPKQWFCNCEKHCKGRTKEVSRSTYQRHAQFRNPAFLDGSGSGRSPQAPNTHYFVPAREKRPEPGLGPHRDTASGSSNNRLGAQAQVATTSRVSTTVRNGCRDLICIHWAHRIVVGAGNNDSRQHWEWLWSWECASTSWLRLESFECKSLPYPVAVTGVL